MLKAKFSQLASKKVDVHTAIVNDVGLLTEASVNIISFITSLILGISCLVYLASISFVLFLLTIIVAAIGASVFHLRSNRNNKNFEKYRQYENDFLENVNSILNGFKEIYMEPKIGKSIYEKKIKKIAKGSYQVNVTAFTGFLSNQITGQILFYLLISSILMFFGIQLNLPSNDIVSFTFTLLYLLSSVETIMLLLPSLARARIAADHLINLQLELQNLTDSEALQKIVRPDFSNITVRNLRYHYENNSQPFSIGPIDFDFHKGEITFIFGGNGSGKTTFIHSILGLLISSEGDIQLNGTSISKEDYPAYRSLFSVVFSDFYLFNELYAIEYLDLEKWDFYIKLFELDGKVSIENNCLSTTELSTGQRKRLALISVLMEEKPILIIDEWAADQDPFFRKKFYLEIIPILKLNGLSIIAITHDDMYYHCADKLYKMEEGCLIIENLALLQKF
ncbi:pyoverdine biosynthesis protein PvdE [Pedobacter psychrotolerans]|uniref:Pyoverdine biosynthesis protein PvdE n=1 Tax=Pedobacter psychrotolerans TaxID=1843235 RepID=A0ABQ1SY52_9SPHI|nr:pyoverdine biosynthesis protein PvdE [Pedobacter psychrotolerans]